MVLAPWEPVDLLLLGLGAVTFGLAAWLLARDPASPVHRTFALFLVLRGLLPVGGAAATVPALAPLVARLFPYAHIAVVFAAVAFALAYRRRHGERGAWRGLAPAAVLLAAIPFEALYLLDHGLWARPGPVYGPLVQFLFLRHVVTAGLALAFASAYLRAPEGRGRSHLVLSLGFALDPAYAAVAVLAARWAYVQRLLAGAAPFDLHFLLGGVLAGAALAMVAAVAWRVRRATRGAGAPHLGRRYLAALAAAAGSYALVLAAGALAGPGAAGTWDRALNGAWSLGLPLLAAYAIVRHRLFDLDVRLKRRVRQGTVAGAFVAVAFAAAQAATAVAGDAGAAVGLLAAGAMLFGLEPLQRLASRVADAALPGADDPASLDRRRQEVYREALEQAIAAGGPGERDRELLAGLRRALGITEHDHRVMEQTLRAVLARGTPAAQAAPARAAREAAGEAGAGPLHGRYRVLRALGEGAAGAAWLCRDERIAREVVVKELRALDPDPAGVAAALREARAIAAVRHPNVVELHDVLHADGRAHLVMEHVAGGSLRERLAGGPLAREEFLRLARDLLAALGAIHAAGIVHRDVKPGNVLLTTEGRAKLADFGVAHLPGFEATMAADDPRAAVGTFRYMSPEQARGREAGPASDLYGAAAVLLEALTGEPLLAPRPGEGAADLRLRAADPGPFRGRVEPPALQAWFAKALDPRPSQRFPSAEAMREALERAVARGGVRK